MPLPDPNKAKVLFDKTQNMAHAFFAEIQSVRTSIGNDRVFRDWCTFQLRILWPTIERLYGFLELVDAEILKKQFEDVRRAEKAHAAAEAHASKLEKIKRENELAAARAENAELKAAQKKANEEAKTEKTRAEIKRRRAEKSEREGQAIDRAKAQWLLDPQAIRDTIAERADVAKSVASAARRLLETSGLLVPKETTADKEKLYDMYVREGRSLVKCQWTLGEFAIEVSKLRVHGEGTLEHYARDIGIEYKTLLNYKSVAMAWPQISRPREISFAIADAIRSHPDRAAIVAKDPHMTCEEAREIMRTYKASSNIVSLNK